MKTYLLGSAVALTLLSGCQLNKTTEKETTEHNNIIVTPSTKLAKDFFNQDGKEFFPLDKWMFNFSYDEKDNKLSLTHLNVATNNNAEYESRIENDTIYIEEKVENNVKLSNKDITYDLKNIHPQVYHIEINGENIDLDLRDINPKWSYSIMETGSVMIAMYDQTADPDEL